MREQKLSLLKYFLKTNVSYYLFTAVYWLALGFNIIVVSIFPTAVNFFILALYVALFVLLRFSLRKKRWGVVVDTKGKPLPFVTLAVYDQSNNIQVARTVSDMHGRYLFVLPRGDYFINATAVRGTTAMRQSFTHKRIRAVTKKITLQV